jgi:hypothetical protein
MPHADPVNWQPISAMPLIASMIDDALDDTRDHLKTLSEARTRPHVLDDATIDRAERVHNEQLEFVDIYAQQISRWRAETPSAEEPAVWQRRSPSACMQERSYGCLERARNACLVILFRCPAAILPCPIERWRI